MKKFLTISSLLFAFFCLQAQDGELKFPKVDPSVLDVAYYPSNAPFRAFAKTPEEKAAAKPVMRLLYSRPLKKDRKIFGELVKYGEMWRIGANESSELLLLQDAKLGDTKIAAGRYTVYAKPSEGEWEIFVSTDTDGWGQYSFKPEESSVASIKVPTQATPAPVEALSVLFKKSDDGAHMVIAWDNTMVAVPFTF